jgi:Kdo2-lipid IVA lauroyltransferase/acyltransferase
MYYILYGLFYGISLLPFWLLYGISDGMYVIVYKVFGYRKNVVLDNLVKSFPDKSTAEIEIIMQKYYHNLCDSIVETIKLISLSDAELNKRYTCNWEVINNLHGKGRIAQAHLSHMFNWEYGTVAAGFNSKFQFTGLYNRITNAAFNKLIYNIRTRRGSIMIDMDDMLKVMAEYQQKNTVWGFIADQNPSEPRRGVWVDFFGRETSFFKGAELIARRYDNIVLFGNMVKIKRGYYKLVLEQAFEHGGQTSDGEITKHYVAWLEECIRAQPENWVWSHRRWKHTRIS